MATLNGTTPAATYQSLIKFDDNSAIGAAKRLLSDGNGGATPIYLSSTQMNIGGTGLIDARLGVKGTGNTAATNSFRAENSTNTSSVVFSDLGQLIFYNGVTQRMNIDARNSTIRFDSSSSNSLGSGAVGIQYATGLPNANGIQYAIGPNESHTFYKLIQVDGGISANTYFTMSLVDGGGTYSNTYKMIEVIPTVNLTGAGAKNVVGYNFKPTLTATANTKIYGAVFENGGLLIGGAAASGNTSAAIEVISTTKGFLPPRMTNAQILLIATPAAGLMVYNTDISTPCFYDGTAWKRLSHSAM